MQIGKPSTSQSGWLAAMAGFSLAGSTVVASRYIGPEIGPFTAVFFSLLAGLPVFVLVARHPAIRSKSSVRGAQPAAGQIWRALAQAAMGIVAFRVFLLEGMRRIDGPTAGILLGLGPVLLGLGGILFFSDRLNQAAWAGVALCSVGVILMRVAPGTQGDPVGALCLLGAVFGETAMSLLGRRSGEQGDSFTNAWLTVLAAALLSLPLALAEIMRNGWPHPAWPGIIALVYYGIGPTALGYLAWSHGAACLDSASLGVANACTPVSAVLLSALFLGDGLGPGRLLSLVLVAIGMLAFAGAGRRSPGGRKILADKETGNGSGEKKKAE